MESVTLRSSSLEPDEILATSSFSFNVTPPPTSGSSTGFVYVDFEDYDEYSSYDDPPLPPGARGVVTTTTTSTSLGHQVETGLPPSVESKTTTPTEPLTIVGVPSEGHTVAPVKISTVPDSYTTVSVGHDDIIAATSSPSTSGETQPQAQINLTAITPTATSLPSSFFTLPKKDNNSGDEVSYRIVGLDGDNSKGQQSYFVPQMPPVRERTQNKRIQQLLNEKRRQGVLRQSSRTRESRTGVRL